VSWPSSAERQERLDNALRASALSASVIPESARRVRACPASGSPPLRSCSAFERSPTCRSPFAWRVGPPRAEPGRRNAGRRWIADRRAARPRVAGRGSRGVGSRGPGPAGLRCTPRHLRRALNKARTTRSTPSSRRPRLGRRATPKRTDRINRGSTSLEDRVAAPRSRVHGSVSRGTTSKTSSAPGRRRTPAPFHVEQHVGSSREAQAQRQPAKAEILKPGAARCRGQPPGSRLRADSLHGQRDGQRSQEPKAKSWDPDALTNCRRPEDPRNQGPGTGDRGPRKQEPPTAGPHQATRTRPWVPLRGASPARTRLAYLARHVRLHRGATARPGPSGATGPPPVSGKRARTHPPGNARAPRDLGPPGHLGPPAFGGLAR
jgi:hypothetical protein